MSIQKHKNLHVHFTCEYFWICMKSLWLLWSRFKKKKNCTLNSLNTSKQLNQIYGNSAWLITVFYFIKSCGLIFSSHRSTKDLSEIPIFSNIIWTHNSSAAVVLPGVISLWFSTAHTRSLRKCLFSLALRQTQIYTILQSLHYGMWLRGQSAGNEF